MRHKHEVSAEESDQETHPSEYQLKSYKEYVPFLIIYLILALIVFWPITLNITGTVAAGNPFITGSAGTGDVYQNLWNLWWVKYALFTIHAPIYFTPMLDYPIGASLVTQTLSPLSAIFSMPFQAISLGFAYNAVFFIGYALCGFFMFLLAYYLIGNKIAAFISGIVFEFSPFHMMHSLGGQLNWANIEFIPLFLLFFLILIRTRKRVAIVGLATSFLLLFFFGDPEQAIITIVAALIIFALSLLNKESRPNILNKKFLISVFSAAILAIILGFPLFLPLINGVLNGALSQANASNPLPGNLIWSDPLLSYFFPSPFNNIFSGIADSYYSIYAATAGPERVAYLGYSVLILVLLGLIHDVRKNGFRLASTWTVLGVMAAWLSLGPYIQMGNPPDATAVSGYIPGLYLLYSKLPIFNIVREPARFDVIVTLCLAVLAGLGFAELLRMLKSKNLDKITFYAVPVIAFIIILEYSGIPFSSAYVNEYFLHLNIPAGYAQIGSIPGNYTLMVLPSQETQTLKPELYLGTQMYYQTAFQKPLISGYTSRVNETEKNTRISIPLSISASQLESGQPFQYLSPITENYTDVTLFLLERYNIHFVSVIDSAYTTNELSILDKYLNRTFGRPFYQDNSTSIWAVNMAKAAAQENSIISYTSGGSWVYACGTYAFCNSTFNTFWWGSSLRVINISAPANKTKLAMSFTVVPYSSGATLAVYLNSDKHRLGISTLPEAITTYSLNLTLSPGMNQLFFISLNPSGQQPTTDFYIGIKNVTFFQR